MRRPRELVATCLLTAPLLAAAAPAAASERTPTTLGAGLAWFSTSDARGRGTDDVGVALSLHGGVRFADHFGFNLFAAWGLTDFDRTRRWFDTGVEGMKWTTGAIEDVSGWIAEDDGWQIPKAMAGFFAYSFLLTTYVFEVLAIAASPFAASTYALAGPTLSIHLDELNLAAEVGIGGMLAVPPGGSKLVTGYGPLAGVFADLDPVALGLRVLWSPAGAHGGATYEEADLLALTATASLRW